MIMWSKITTGNLYVWFIMQENWFNKLKWKLFIVFKWFFFFFYSKNFYCAVYYKNVHISLCFFFFLSILLWYNNFIYMHITMYYRRKRFPCFRSPWVFFYFVFFWSFSLFFSFYWDTLSWPRVVVVALF